MKLRSKSPFGRRRNVRDLLDDVRKAGDAILNINSNNENETVGILDTSTEESNSILQNSILSTPTAQQKSYVDDRRRDWSQSQYEEHSKNLEGRDSESEQRRNLSESEVAKQKKTAELVQKTRQMVLSRKEKKEAESALAVDRSNTTTPTSQSRSSASKQQKSRRFSRHKSMGQQQQQQQQQVVEVKKVVKSSPRKSRSKSPFRRWRKAEDLVTDIRQKELNVPQTPSTSSCSVPLRSTGGTPPAAATSTPSRTKSPQQSRTSRSKSPFRRLLKGSESTNGSSIPLLSAAGTPPAAATGTPSTPSRTQNSEQSRKSRSKSPFRRFFKSGDLIKHVNLVEQDFAFELQRKPSQQISTRGRSPASPSHRRKKAKELIPDNGKDGQKEVEVVLSSPARSRVASLSSKASKSSPSASPAKEVAEACRASPEEDLQERRSFRNPFSRTVTPSATTQSKAKQQAAAAAAAAVVSGYETPQRRSSLWGKKSEIRVAPAKENKSKSPQPAVRSIPRTITKCNRSTVSDLSSPAFSGGRCRSISDDSARQVRKALQRNLGSESRSVKSVKTVMATLLEVTDKLESEADKKTLRNALNRLETAADSDGSSTSSADSESSPYDSRLGEDEDETEYDFEDDFEFDDASSFTRWEDMGRVTVQSILAMIGLPYLWNRPETVEEEVDEDSTSTSSTNASEKSTDETDDAPVETMAKTAPESPIASKAKQADDQETLNLIMDDDEMLRELEELDHKMKLEKERATRKKIEAEREEKKRKLEAEKAGESKEKKDATLKARLERRRKREIMISEQKTREAEALKQLKAAEDARLRREAEAEKKRKIVAQVQAEEFARQQEQAAKEATKKKRIRLEEIKEAARRREAEERRKKVQLQKAVEATRRRKQAEEADQKKRRDQTAKVLLANAKAAKMRRAEFQHRRYATRSQRSAATSSSYSTDTDPCPFPKPISQNLRSEKATSFRPLREDEISSIANSDTDFDSRLTSTIWSDEDDFSLGSVESSQFDVPQLPKYKRDKLAK